MKYFLGRVVSIWNIINETESMHCNVEKAETMNVLFIIPYPSMKEDIQSILQRYPYVEATYAVGNVEESIAITGEVREHTSIDAIISRGGTAEILRSHFDIPVFSIPMTSNDLGKALHSIQTDKKIALVGYPTITMCAAYSETKNFGREDIYTVTQSDRIPEVMKVVKEKGYDFILCDVISSEVAASFQLETKILLSSLESIQLSIDEAVYFYSQRRAGLQAESIQHAILKDRDIYYVSINNMGEVISSNLPGHVAVDELMELVETFFVTYLLTSKTVRTVQLHNGQRLLFYLQKQVKEETTYYIVTIKPDDFDQISNDYGIRLFRFTSHDPSRDARNLKTSLSLGKIRSTLHPFFATQDDLVIYGEGGTGKIDSVLYIALNQKSRFPIAWMDAQSMNESMWSYFFDSFLPMAPEPFTILIQNAQQCDTKTLKRFSFLRRRDKILHRFLFTLDAMEQSLSSQLTLLEESPAVQFFRMPSLSERRDELVDIIDIYLKKYKIQTNKPIAGFEPKALDLLVNYSWPGNLEQLQRVLRTLFSKTTHYYLTEDEVTLLLFEEKQWTEEGKVGKIPHDQPLAEMIYHIVCQVMREEDMNQTRTAKRLQIGRTTVWRILKGKGR